MIEWLKSFISISFEFIPAPKTVASITSGVLDTIKELEAHAAEQIEMAKAKTLDAARLLKEHAEHAAEHQKASKVAQNFKALIG